MDTPHLARVGQLTTRASEPHGLSRSADPQVKSKLPSGTGKNSGYSPAVTAPENVPS